MKAMLLRVGIDKGTDGALGPIFDDGSFEYIPKSERERSDEDRTYRTIIGRRGHPLSLYLPNAVANRVVHYDPEFETYTYGDPTSKRKHLLKLDEEDLLVFYAGLAPFKNSRHREALYIIGYFTVSKKIDFNKLSGEEIEEAYRLYPNNAHMKKVDYSNRLVIIVGAETRSKLLPRAVLISQKEYNKGGKPCEAVSSDMKAALGVSGFIQRSIPPRFITNKKNIDNLRGILGL
jgi:hypothetical protein